MSVLEMLSRRGLIQQVSEPALLEAALAAGPVTFYAGFDPTADSLHAGHLLPVMLMRWLQQAGHRPIVVLGGGTARVGDPTGKDRTRDMLSPEQIAHNLRCQKAQLARFLDFEGPAAAVMVDNADWLVPLRYIDFLRDIGRHFSVNRMLTAEGTRQRLERNQGLSFIEFNYHLLQSYDFLYLYQRHGCTLQVGGDDQWFHLLGGVDLIRRVEGGQAFAMTVPLLLTADGKKMGKTEGGALFLDAARTCPYDYFQYWLNCDDADVRKMLCVYTALPLERVEELCAAEGQGLVAAKRELAMEATTLAHGREEAAEARRVSDLVFRKEPLDEGERAAVLRALAGSGSFPRVQVGFPLSWAEAAVAGGLCASKGEARRLVQQGGARIWQQRVDDAEQVLAGPALIWAGKKKAALILGG